MTKYQFWFETEAVDYFDFVEVKAEWKAVAANTANYLSESNLGFFKSSWWPCGASHIRTKISLFQMGHHTLQSAYHIPSRPWALYPNYYSMLSPHFHLLQSIFCKKEGSKKLNSSVQTILEIQIRIQLKLPFYTISSYAECFAVAGLT